MSEGPYFKIFGTWLLIAVVGFGIYISAAENSCKMIERATLPLVWANDGMDSLSKKDHGWSSYRLKIAEFIQENFLEDKKACHFIGEDQRTVVEEILKEKTLKVTDDEKNRIIGIK